MCNCNETNKDNTITMQDAENFMSSYVSTLQSGNAEAIKKFWSDKSVHRTGFEVMHLWVRGLIHISEWKSFLDSTQYAYRINDLLEENGYYVINGEWFTPDNSESHTMPFYLIRENEKWLLINPVDVLTKNWSRYKTNNLIFIYPETINIDDHIQGIKLLDEQFIEMCKAMEFSFDHKIEYYKASSPEECGRLLTQPPFNGLAAVTYQDSIKWFQIAVSTTFYNAHELMHIVALSSGVPYSNSFFSEGLAVAFGGTTFQTAEFAHNYSKLSLDRSDYVPVKRLITMAVNDFLQLSYITYQESGSFIRYLIDMYGIGKLKEFISNFNINDDLDDQALRVYGVTLDNLENNWQKYLRNIELPQIGFTIPGQAELVFSMADPENDDEGDGDYNYPANEKYIEGCFDLTKFEVFKDKDSVYFRTALHKVIEPASNRPGGVKFIPMVVIAINKGDQNKRQLCKYTNEVELAEGYDLKINAGFGINISNNLGKIFVSTGDLYHEMTDPQSNTLTFSLPIELIGEPDNEWKYFVGVGLTNEPAFNFSGLIPVFKSHPGLISGGNYDYSNPAFIDILLPGNIDQADMLSDYNSKEGKLAEITMNSNNSTGL
jgi:hypothetical protein